MSSGIGVDTGRPQCAVDEDGSMCSLVVRSMHACMHGDMATWEVEDGGEQMSEVSASVRTLGSVPWNSWSFLQCPGVLGGHWVMEVCVWHVGDVGALVHLCSTPCNSP